MLSQLPAASRLNRKGIYQTFDAGGNVIADERWRIKPTLDGGVRIDMDTARIAPFIEPRTETVSLELAADATPRRLVIHALAGRRESRVDITPGRADVCWRCDDLSRTHEFSWSEACEIDYNSVLFTMAAAQWRYGLLPGESASARLRRRLRLDNVSFEPSWVQSTIANLGQERHDTRFGAMELTHYHAEDDAQTGISGRDWWCDQTGVIFDLTDSNGSGYKLVAVNFTG